MWFYTAILQVAKTVDIVKAKGGKVTREPSLVKGGSVVTASVEDPSGYRFELLERKPTREPLSQVNLQVGDLDGVVAFYQKVSVFTFLIVMVLSACLDVNTHK
jgi:lactoylglutathione lyase